MFLIEMIILLIIISLSSLKITLKRKTGNESWGEPVVTILQILGMVVLVLVITAERVQMVR